MQLFIVQSAEELLIEPDDGKIQLLADATSATQYLLSANGGLVKQRLPADGQVLDDADIERLIDFARELSRKFPQLDDRGEKTAADVEFGFLDGKLVLFQVRPYLKNRRVKKHAYLNRLDHGLDRGTSLRLNLAAPPGNH